jgi:hypothetical protein
MPSMFGWSPSCHEFGLPVVSFTETESSLDTWRAALDKIEEQFEQTKRDYPQYTFPESPCVMVRKAGPILQPVIFISWWAGAQDKAQVWCHTCKEKHYWGGHK